MTPAQLLYPLIALAELTILLRAGRSRAQNAAALRMWLVTQLVIFCILEPLSVAHSPFYSRCFLICSVASAAADLVVFYSIFLCLEDDVPVLGSWKVWGSMALLIGMLFCLGGSVSLPAKARGIQIVWLTVAQTYTYLRALALIALAVYGWLRSSSWPRDLAWSWLGMAMYGLTDSIVQRIQILSSNTALFETVTSIAALAQLAGFWRALSYSPKPLTSEELDGLDKFRISSSLEG